MYLALHGLKMLQQKTMCRQGMEQINIIVTRKKDNCYGKTI